MKKELLKRKLGQYFLLSAILLLNTITVFAQEVSVSGTVTDETGPLPGVTVVVKGTTNGTVTDIDGNYSLSGIPGDATLQFSFVGMLSQEIAIGNQTTINVTMVADAIGIEEVVAIGYGTREKQAMTGSISSVKADKLTLNSTGNVSQALQGMASGVTVINSNRPGSSASIKIRGLGSINSNSPLWVIDGVVTEGGINNLSPSEIESVTVLKDAASTAIYGAAGANGVILVTTLKGNKSQAPKVNLNVRYGVIDNTKRWDMLDVEEFGEMFWLQAKNSGIEPSHPLYGSGPEPVVPKYILPAGANDADLSIYDIWKYPITEANAEGTDWYDEIFNQGAVQEYTVSVTGGSDNSTYGLGVGYLDEEGMVKLTGYERYNFRSNLSLDVNDWLELGENFGLSHSNNWGYQSEAGANATFGQLLQLAAIAPVRDIMGNWAPVSRITGLMAQNNPVAEAERGKDNTRKNLGIIGNIYAKVDFLKDFSYKTTFGINFNDHRTRQPLETNPDSYMARQEHQLTEYSSVGRQWSWTNTLNYKKTINDNHTIDILMGTEAITSSVNYFGATRDKYLLADDNYFVLNAGEGEMSNSGSISEWATMSYFGRLHYEFNNKYLFDATVRHDGCSRFGKNSRWGTFPAFSLGWRLSNENFMSSTKNWLDYLKLRASWGQSGNNKIGNYNGFTFYGSNRMRSFYPITGSNSEIVSGFESFAFGNPDAKWETNTSINFGVDAALFSFVDIGIDLWQRNTTDMLYAKAIPKVYGNATAPAINIGDMKNTGFDIDLNIHGDALNNDFKYSINTTISHYKNELVKISDKENEVIGGGMLRSEPGTAYPEYFGYIVEGIFQTEEEAANHAPAFGDDYNKPGHFIYKDVNGRDEEGNLTGEPDGKVDDADRTYIGSPHPDFTAGIQLNLSYKNFDLIASFYATIGADVYNQSRQTLDFNYYDYRNRGKRRLYESWGSPYLDDNKNAKMPIAELNDAISQRPSTYFVEDASYFRMQSLQIGYTLPKKLANKLSMNNLRLYVMASNLFTITNYSGLDPAIPSALDEGMWPTPKRYTIGVNVGF